MPKPRTKPARSAADPVASQPSHGALATCEVASKPIMSRTQSLLGNQLRDYCAAHGLHLHGEVAMSAILSVSLSNASQQRAGFNAIGRKRVDFCLTDTAQRPVCIVEYQGSGYFMGGGADTEKRDRTKRAAFAMARLPLLEVPARWSWPQIRAQLDALIGQTQTARDLSVRARA